LVRNGGKLCSGISGKVCSGTVVKYSPEYALSDLPTYLQFKFYAKVSKEMQGILRDKLFELSNSKVNLDRYDRIVQKIKHSTNYRVPSQEFFKEIDSLLDAILNPSQLSIVR
jgi:hypothetical protein